MYKHIQVGIKNSFVIISVFTSIFIAICGNYVLAADFKSEEELIDETRTAIEKEMKAGEADKPTFSVNKKVVKEETLKEQEPIIVEEKPVVEEKAIVSKPAIVEEKPVVEEPAIKEEAVSDAAPVKEETGPDVTPVNLTENNTDNNGQQPVGEEVDFISDIKQPEVTKPLVEPVLKKTDINRISASPYYETYEGLRLLKYFTVAQRVELYQEPRPVDSYILDAFSMNKLYGYDWYHDVNYRSQILPIFTRAYGTEITMSDPKNKEGQIRYTHDYREIYKNYYPKYPNIKWEHWDQNDILFMHAKIIEPIEWFYTSNVGYRYSTMEAKGDPNYYEVRHTYYGSLSLAPNEKFEWFGQAEYYKSMHLKTSYDYRPDHFLGRTEVRIKSNDMKTSFVPSFSYSKDYYYPFANTYQKYEIQYRVGRDFTKRFSATSTIRYVMGLRDEPDNTAPLYAAKNPFKDKAYAISWENRFSYNIYDRLYLQAGFDLSNGLNLAAFDNYGLLAGFEYYAPGMIRVDFGWRGNHYYNIDDFLSTLYFKFYLFM